MKPGTGIRMEGVVKSPSMSTVPVVNLETNVTIKPEKEKIMLNKGIWKYQPLRNTFIKIHSISMSMLELNRLT